MYDIHDLAWFLLLLIVAAYWWRTSEQKSVAVRAAREYCRERGLQFLDETLVFHRFRLERNLKGKRRLCRVYEFDYCLTGEDRHTGELVLWGYTVMRIIVRSSVLEITDYQR